MASLTTDSNQRPDGKAPVEKRALFIFIGHDGAAGPERRNEHRAGHLEYMATLHREGQLVYGGPIRDESNRSIGAMLVFAAPDMTAARALAESDPYVRGGVYAGYELRPFVQVFPR